MPEISTEAVPNTDIAVNEGAAWKPTTRERNWLHARMERGKRERTVEFATVTPGLASLMLEYNLGNRPITPSKVAAHVDRLMRGDYMLTHQGFAFAKTGQLNDGQHRLTAVVASGIPAEFTITFGAEREEFWVIDQVKSRGAADILGIMGDDNRALRAAIAKTLLQVKQNKAATFDPQLVADYAVELRGQAMDAAILKGQSMSRVCAPTAVAVAHYWIDTRTQKPLQFHKFWEGLRDGENISGLKLRLREWMKVKADAAVGDRTIWRAGGIINAWNSLILGKRTFDRNWKHVTKLPDVL